MSEDVWAPEDEIRGDRVTVFAGALAQPIADLVQALALGQIKSARNEVGERENGYCISIVVLVVAVFESLLGRVSHLRRLNGGIERQKNEGHALKYLRNVDPQFPEQLLDHLEDIYLLRDAVVHAHVWTIEYTLGRGGTTVNSRERHPGYGDSRHKDRVDESSAIAKSLQLKVTPDEIGLRHASIAIKTIALAVKRLVDVKAIELPAVVRRVRYQGKSIGFWTLGDKLDSLWLEKPER